MILLLLESKDTRSIVSKIKFTWKEVHYTRENRNMDESFDMIRKDMRNLKIRGGCNRFDETKNFRKRKIAGKSGNHSSIPLTIHATESIIQLPISHLGVDFTRSQETRIEFASRGRDPDLSSLIDGAREIGGGVVKCKGEGRFSFFLSFFFSPDLARNNRHGFRVSLLRESRSADSLRCLPRDPLGLHAEHEKHLLPCKSILASVRLILNLSQILLSPFLHPRLPLFYILYRPLFLRWIIPAKNAGKRNLYKKCVLRKWMDRPSLREKELIRSNL